MGDELVEDAPLTADEILTFGACVESQVWHPVWLQEARAPIAVAAGRPKLGRVFDDSGVGRAVVIRPCMSRGRRVRGLPPVYTPRMLESHAKVFEGWPMFMDHVPAALAQTVAKHGRSIKDIGGQVLRADWQRDFVREDDASYGYQPGAVTADIWATPLIRRTVAENANLLHTSINAWPTSGKPGPVPWRPATKGMLIEGIRRQPQGSVDFVVRGGAGGRLLMVEGVEQDEPGWPEVGEWDEDQTKLVVSVAESLYASRAMSDLVLPTDPGELREWLEANAPHLVPALSEANDDDADDVNVKVKAKRKVKSSSSGEADTMTEGISRDDVSDLIAEALANRDAGVPSVDEFEQRLQERVDETLREAAQASRASNRAVELINGAEGIPPSWKADLVARYSVTENETPATVLVEGEFTDEDGNALTPVQVVEQRVATDLQHLRDLLAEARGKPRPKGEGARRQDSGDAGNTRSRRRRESAESSPFWRERFASLGLAESEDAAAEIFGVEKAED